MNNVPRGLANTLLAQQIDDAVKRKDYSWLETNSRQIHDAVQFFYSNVWMPWNTDISPFKSAFENKDLTAMKLLFQPFVSFHTYNQLKSTDRVKIAPVFIEAQSTDPKARIHTMLLFMNAVNGLNLDEVKFWHEQGDLFHELARSQDYTMKKRPIEHIIDHNKEDVFKYLHRCTYCSEQHRPAKIRLMIQKLLRGAFGMAEVLWEDLSPATQKLPLLNPPNSPSVSLIHNVLLRDKFDKLDRAGAIKWLLEKGTKDFDKDWKICDKYQHSFLNPAFVAACYINDAAAAKVLLEHDPEWRNNVGPILEILPVWRYDIAKGQRFVLEENDQKANDDEISNLLDLLVPLLNPDTRDSDLANALAASILYENEFLEAKLRALGADLRHVSRTDEYYFGKGRTYAIRLKLLNVNGDPILPIEDQDNEYIVGEVAIDNRNAKPASIKKKMNAIHPDSDIYFNSTVNLGPKKIAHRVDSTTPIKVWDRETGLIYKDTPFIRSLFVGVPPNDGKYHPIIFGDKLNTYSTRYSVFVLSTEGLWANGYRIMYKPVAGHNIVRVIESPKAEKAEVKDKEEEEIQLMPRRSSRAAKRKHDEDGHAIELDEQPAKNKRRKVAKK